MGERVRELGLASCEEMVLILPQAKHCQQDLTLQNNFPITF